MHRSIVVAIVVLFTACANAQQPSSAKREEIKQLLLISVSSQAAWYAMVEPIVEPARKLNPSAAPAVWAELSSYLKDAMLKAVSGPGGFIERTVAVFDREFSEDEIKQMSAFVRSDLGRKFFMATNLLAVEMDRDQDKMIAAILPEIQIALVSFFASHGLKMQ